MLTRHPKEAVVASAAALKLKSRLLSITRRQNSRFIHRSSSEAVIETAPFDRQPIANEPQSGSRPPIKLVSFLIMVAIPFLITAYYFIFLATDQYIAEARFAIRSLADESSTEASDGGGVLAMNSATQDAYVVTSFIHSPELLQRIAKTLDYRSIFTGDGVDFLSRFDPSSSNEEFQEYWRKHVSAYIDGPSGIITLQVRTFSPESSKRLGEVIIAESERLINELNHRAQQDMVASLRGEVERTSRDYADTLEALNQFQRESGLIKPEMQAQSTGKMLTGLLEQKLQLETRIFVLKQSAAEDSPAFTQLVRAQSSIDSQIEQLRSELTGPENASLVSAILGYTRLETNRIVAEKLYEASRSSYETALAASLRKALYVMVFVRPTMPEESLYPRRFSMPFIIALGLFVTWATLILLWASVEDHKL